jgi:hypothetical protein
VLFRRRDCACVVVATIGAIDDIRNLLARRLAWLRALNIET